MLLDQRRISRREQPAIERIPNVDRPRLMEVVEQIRVNASPIVNGHLRFSTGYNDPLYHPPSTKFQLGTETGTCRCSGRVVSGIPARVKSRAQPSTRWACRIAAMSNATAQT